MPLRPKGLTDPLPRDASTVAILRGRPSARGGGLEVLLMTRPDTSLFAPGAEVFPGGAVDPADLDPGWAELAGGVRLQPRVDRSFLVAAVRETFEECGVLIARDSAGHVCQPRAAAAAAPLRRELQGSGSDRFLPGLRALGLRPGWEDLVLCAHWMTPKRLPRIYDTRFFMAAMPREQEPRQDDGGELFSMRWVAPSTALEDAVQHRNFLFAPTRAVLRQLASERSVAAALRAAGRMKVQRVRPGPGQARYPGLDPGEVLGGD
ncbi:MAG TPA: NUDIX hydrolase [Candidatus Dormibacteraeota bacterium]|nr:NUDIX hydrolase [Candidatus Dormibacteraeota bacterium]